MLPKTKLKIMYLYELTSKSLKTFLYFQNEQFTTAQYNGSNIQSVPVTNSEVIPDENVHNCFNSEQKYLDLSFSILQTQLILNNQDQYIYP